MKEQIPPGIPLAIVHYVFHELHADGRHALCAVCDGQYWSPAGK